MSKDRYALLTGRPAAAPGDLSLAVLASLKLCRVEATLYLICMQTVLVPVCCCCMFTSYFVAHCDQVLDTAGNLRYIPVNRLPTEATTDYTRRCPTTYLFKFSGSYSGYTGLAAAYRSDVSTASPVWACSKCHMVCMHTLPLVRVPRS